MLRSAMHEIKLNLIAAACASNGIGINGNLPWRLRNEMDYFTRMTKSRVDSTKMNAVIMGRVTWDCIPKKYKPLDERINIVISRQADDLKHTVPEGVIVVKDLDDALVQVKKLGNVEKVWVIGGSYIYKLAMSHPACDKIYLTEINKEYECDTFFPRIDPAQFTRLSSHAEEDFDVPMTCQKENDVEYYFRIYKKNPSAVHLPD